MKRTLIRLGLSVLVTSALFGCGGGGSDGINGPTVTVPIIVSNAQNVGSNQTTATSASIALWRSLEPKVTVTSVSIVDKPVVRFAVTDAAGNAVVGLGNTSQSSTARFAGLVNVRFTLAKLVPATATEPSKWVSYIVVAPTTVAQAAGTGTFSASDSCDEVGKQWCGTYPTTEQEGTLVDNGDGTYVYTFKRDITQAAAIVASLKESTDGLKKKTDLGDVSYNATLTHRLGIQISGAAPGTGSNVPNGTTVITGVNIAIPTNVAYDFVPNGGVVTSTRSVVDVSSCDSCHNGKGLVHSRKDPNYCVTCHTDQVKYSMSSEVSRSLTDPLALTSMSSATDNGTAVLDGRALGNYPNLVHKIHMGNELSLSGYNYKRNAAGRFDQNEWIQDPRDCTKCHSGDAKSDVNQATQTKDGNNWKTKPSRLACGACHDNVNFATGVIYEAGGTTSVHPNMVNGAANAVPTPYTDDSSCSSCHGAADISVYHRAEAPTANNPTVIAGISTISYDLKSVVVASSTGATAFTFRIIKDGTPVTALTTGSQAIPGFNSGPSFYVAYAVPQDGIAAPADFNAYSNASLASLISATNGTLTGPDTSGYWTATLTAASLKVPTSGVNKAAMVTGAIIGNFTQVDFNATKTAGLIDITTDLGKKWNTCNTTVSPTICPNGTANPGLFLKTPLAKIGAKLDTTAYSLRRVVVDTNKCESCHEQLGAAVEFHSGARNDATSCAICHNPNRTSSGWAANASTFIHGIHAGTDLASVTAITKTGGSGIANVGVPGTGAGGAGLGYNSGKRYIPFSWHRAGTATVPTWNAAAMVYPGILKRCENCHVPNAVNFGASGSSLLPTLLWSTSAARGSLTATAPAIANPYLDYDLDTVKAFPRDPVTGASPYPNLISASGGTTTLGVAFSFAASTGVSTAAAGTTLVESPVTAACFACHNANTARLHMTQYGGVIYGTRTANYTSVVNTTYGGQALNNQETCLICHGMGRDQDAAVVHAKK